MKTASIAGGRLNPGGDGQNRTADLWVMNQKALTEPLINSN